MIEKMEFKSDFDSAKWYNKRFSEFGAFETSEKYNLLMLEWLGIKEKTDKKLLDVGCGGGFFLKQAEKFLNCTGIDFSKEALLQAKKNCNSKLVLGSASNLPFKNNSFDFVVCLGSLEHFIEIEKSLKEMNRVLKKNGKINLFVPNSEFILFKLNPVTAHQPNERFASLKEWEKLIGKYLEIESVHKFTHNPIGKLIPKNFTYSFSFICRGCVRSELLL
ncbi:MAG: hypothetical protein COT90_03640 [Candidatus Diapherotrites archaeon CG10_big_fil_rev_8_21_14_0_10_31_34]|nr:MAG: hypothetical protein COT90_03640 [Candidatus Diapherotrites archaeon CG10_big_fil_rev_8_21_14_0_10_31_34]